MFDIIVAHNYNDGIGLCGKIPWSCPEDLRLFKKLTSDSVLIMGRKTVESLPKLPGRIIFCLSRSGNLTMDNNESKIFSDLEQALQAAKDLHPNKKVFVAGGAEIYNLVLTTALDHVDNIHISVIDDFTICDTHVPDIWSSVRSYSTPFTLVERVILVPHTNSIYYHFAKGNIQESQYISILKEITQHGVIRQGRNGETKSLFGKNMTFDLRKGFPLLTTKKMFFRGIIEELLFFLRGDTNSKLLEEKGVKIWKGNTNRAFLDKLCMYERKEGIMGPLYGYQWRFFNAKYDEKTGKPLEQGIDQLKLVVDTIRKDPCSRRIMMTDFNPAQATEGVLYPCHSIIMQFYVSDFFLDMYCYNRSQDFFLGTPFNIASSALLLSLIASVTNLTPRYLYMGLGDVHIYQPHYVHVLEQIERLPHPFPKLVMKKVPKEISDLETLTSEDIGIENYHSHSAIKAEMVI